MVGIVATRNFHAESAVVLPRVTRRRQLRWREVETRDRAGTAEHNVRGLLRQAFTVKFVVCPSGEYGRLPW